MARVTGRGVQGDQIAAVTPRTLIKYGVPSVEGRFTSPREAFAITRTRGSELVLHQAFLLPKYH
jgi:hypothetical protein